MTVEDAEPAPVAHIREHPEIIEGDLDLLRALAPGARSALDVGAGPGGFVAKAARRGMQVVGLDSDVSARARWRAQGISCVVGDGFHLPFRPASFDVVRIKEVIEHVQEPLDLVLAACGVLRPGGLVIAHVPSPYSQFSPVANFWDDYTHVRPLTKTGLSRLFVDAGLEVIHLKGYIAGRNSFERVIGGVVGRFLPHTYRIVGRRR